MPQFLYQLTPYLWVAQSELYFTNSGIFLSGGQGCLIDPALFPHEIEAISQFAIEHNVQPQIVMLTHCHWDHILAPEHLPGVRVIAQADYLKAARENKSRIQRQVRRWADESGIPYKEPFAIPAPDETFGDKLDVAVGDQTLTLIHAPGHAPDQLVVYHQGTAMLWAGDMLSDLEIPYVCDRLRAYEQTLSRLSALDVGVLIPGHGHATSDAGEIRSRFAEDRAYLEDLQGRVGKALAEGRTIMETVTLCTTMRYRDPETNRAAHEKNVESAYIELGGTARGAKVGWDRLSSETS